MSEIVVVAMLKVKEGKVDEAISGFRPVIEQTHGEEGCISYALHRDNADPDNLVLVERWRSQTDLDAHFTQPHLAALGSLASEVLSEPPRTIFCSALPVGDPAKGVL
ncbi:MAG: hypothetical protein QG596_1803 [Actinomycetota bacterium]|jgi:quinol monooxygenase YgiN|nr:hypothetical protein [Actinomycetota bacterium]